MRKAIKQAIKDIVVDMYRFFGTPLYDVHEKNMVKSLEWINDRRWE